LIRHRAELDGLDRTAAPEQSRAGFLRLERNELVPELDQAAFDEIISALTPASFSAYPSLGPLYAELAASLGVSEDQLLIGAGSDWIIRACFETFCSPGDHVLLPVPTYGMYEVYAQINGTVVDGLPHRDDFSLPLDVLLDRLRAGQRTPPVPRVLGLANPNGALGSYVTGSDLEPILRRARESDVLVVLDEAYVDYVGDTWLPRLGEFPNLVLVRTFSKAWGLAGLRVGYAIGGADLIGGLRRVRPNVEINQVGVEAARYLLRRPGLVRDHVQRTLAGKQLLTARLARHGLAVVPGSANFLQVRLGPCREAVLARLAAAQILVKDQRGAGPLDGWTRITVGPAAQVSQVADVVDEVMARD
jgi:histidinol-phosphate aminotransferase